MTHFKVNQKVVFIRGGDIYNGLIKEIIIYAHAIAYKINSRSLLFDFYILDKNVYSDINDAINKIKRDYEERNTDNLT